MMRNKMSGDSLCSNHIMSCLVVFPHLDTLLLQLLEEGRVLYLLL